MQDWGKFALIMAIYASFSVAGMTIVKAWYPGFHSAWTAGAGYVRPGLMLGLGAALYVISFLTWMAILARTPLTTAYPIAVGVTMMLSTASAIFILGEAVSLSTAAGMLLVFAGIFLLSR